MFQKKARKTHTNSKSLRVYVIDDSNLSKLDNISPNQKLYSFTISHQASFLKPYGRNFALKNHLLGRYGKSIVFRE